ncbi:type III restriction endonuclease [Microbacterium barkeri]|uniref:site-specific DNA-methyltransferase (adenine-specific) n=1 Tax=Microbacterium barkeri TaxID=33917 RepID=A0A9W6H331_9MICO|nr:Eco57I restriction-modification methylase domain-containing protein [Microbacterium barkeri]MDR6878169.1 site-specific DNA-methyltransferase (adenine-specific) [Microbacterium barkeri]GLJ61446.1 type III restriction endonuclease [Microbacterium barkeri]
MSAPIVEGKATFALHGHNPDVLTCIANLSNDEVFTPPEFANQMLDTLEQGWAESNDGAVIWSDPTVTFLDPFTKSGVFLREITRRLTDGLADVIPDLEERVDHILTKQVFGIAITQLTALLARRSVYCSRDATGPHSIAKSFDRDWGNIWFERTEHTWEGGRREFRADPLTGREIAVFTNRRCRFCGASESEYARDDALETHAYAFIHASDIRARIAELFGADMQFDVIIGNPPYQLSTGGTGGNGTQARPLYPRFVEQAKAMEPRFVVMVTPSRWFSGGMGLDSFRESMLADTRLRTIADYPDSSDVFPGTQIKGGISYWLWDRDGAGDVTVETYGTAGLVSSSTRSLVEKGSDVFIRYNEGVSILRKVMSVEHEGGEVVFSLPPEKRFMNLVSSIGSFGLDTGFRGNPDSREGDVKVYRNGGVGWIERSAIPRDSPDIDAWKVFVPAAGSGSDSFPHSILGKPFVGSPGTASSWTYMYVGPLESENTARSVCSYIATRFFRFLVLLHKPTQHATRPVYTFVPMQKFSEHWSDDALYEKYALNSAEIAFIESMIRPMELGNE